MPPDTVSAGARPQRALAPAQLRWTLAPDALDFDQAARADTAALPFGQARAASAIRLALAIGGRDDGYNVFVMGPRGAGKRTLVLHMLREHAAACGTPDDWVYVNNFEAPEQPRALRLPPGQGVRLADDMAHLVEELKSAIPAVFESDEYRGREGRLQAEFSQRHDEAFSALAEEAAAEHVAVLRTPAGFSVAPVKGEEVMSGEDFAALPEGEQKRIHAAIERLQEKLEGLVRRVIDWRREWRERLKALNREMTLIAVGHLTGELKARYAPLPRVVAYLVAVENDVLGNADDFRTAAQEGIPSAAIAMAQQSAFDRYSVNVVVGRADAGAPVVEADHPTHGNLIGRIDHVSRFGALVTDFTLVRPGALHRANGGCLVIDAQKLLTQPFAWDALKRALTKREIAIESVEAAYGLASTVSLTPEPIPLAVRLVLIGDRTLYYLLHRYDPEFAKLFKAVADFDDELEANRENLRGYAALIGALARERSLLPFDGGATARLIEHSVRLAGDTRKLDANIEALADAMCEADQIARGADRVGVCAADVAAAIEVRRARSGRLHARLQEAILRGSLVIDTSGSRVGEVNALSVYEVGDAAFAAPTRITATTRLGEGQVIDVQREVELGGPIHSKGVLILASFLASRFSHNRPHSLAASLVFEQTYGPVEGDSASLAELCALLSSLADVPMRQSLAVTGSVNQLGEVQSIGGVNEKIEGFFGICAARGLTGAEGVIIPASNIPNLMLEPALVEAAAAGRFSVYAVRTVDEAIALLTGLSAGEPDAAGAYPAASVNGRAARRLRELTRQKLRLAAASLGGRRTPDRAP